jgi:hypothetical protein
MFNRVAVIVLAAWVLFSGNAWAHSPGHLLNNAIVGAGLIFFGGLAIRHDWARFVTLALGVWLFAFSVFAHSDPITFWNDAMVAVAIFILSLLGGAGRRVLGGGHAPA